MTPDEEHEKLKKEGYFLIKDFKHQMSKETKAQIDEIKILINKLENHIDKQFNEVQDTFDGLSEKVRHKVEDKEFEAYKASRKNDLKWFAGIAIVLIMAVCGFFWTQIDKLDSKIGDNYQQIITVLLEK